MKTRVVGDERKRSQGPTRAHSANRGSSVAVAESNGLHEKAKRRCPRRAEHQGACASSLPLVSRRKREVAGHGGAGGCGGGATQLSGCGGLQARALAERPV